MVLFREQKTLKNQLNKIHVNSLVFFRAKKAKMNPKKGFFFFKTVLTVLWPERILDTEASFKLLSLLFETQIRVDSSCGEKERNLCKSRQ